MNTKQIIKLIGCTKLSLSRCKDYWYFIYDDIPNGIFETESVYTVNLKDLSLEEWISIGKSLSDKHSTSVQSMRT